MKTSNKTTSKSTKVESTVEDFLFELKRNSSLLEGVCLAKAIANDAMLHVEEASKLVAKFVAKNLGAPRHVGSDFVDVLEALVGGAQVVQMFAGAMKGVELAEDAYERFAVAR